MLREYDPTTGGLRGSGAISPVDPAKLTEARETARQRRDLLPPFYWAAFVLERRIGGKTDTRNTAPGDLLVRQSFLRRLLPAASRVLRWVSSDVTLLILRCGQKGL